jgi:dTDP-4-dehydrorhamnose reductase
VKLLVLGSTGQLGADLVRAATRRTGVDVLGAGRDVVDLSAVDSIEESLADIDVDVVVNCAAFTAVDAAESDPGTAFRVNAYGVEGVARACARADRRLVEVSTDYVFDGESDRPYRPEDPPAPINVYGASKLAGEGLARRALPSATTVIRTSSLFGGPGSFVETMLRLAGERARLAVVDDITMAPTFSADLAGAILDLVAADPGPGTWHVTNEGRTTWYDFARAILGVAGFATPVDPVPSAEYPTAARRPRFSVLDTSASVRRVGALPPWEDALARHLRRREEP